MKIYNIKQGDTFSIKPSTLTSDSGAIVPLTGYSFKCQVRDKADTLVADLVMTVDLGTNTVSSDDIDTTDWPLIDLYCDVEMTKAGIVISTDTFNIKVEKDISHS